MGLLFFIGMSLIPAGTYPPFFSPEPRKPVTVDAFDMDVHPVTHAEFLEFVTKRKEWRRSNAKKVFVDGSYLKNWKSDLELQSPLDKTKPVTQISWFAAAAYCEAQGKELPTTDQWEYVAEDANREPEKLKAKILNWYSVPSSDAISSVGTQGANGYGVSDLFGLIWEWTQDFNNPMSSAELRSAGTKDSTLFCGAGSLGALDASNYAKFMRYSFRSSLKANYTTLNLGFRCAKEEK
jgi:formylglycine-generating enzyme required for sulfatase activity